jgi:hypothetical protein
MFALLERLRWSDSILSGIGGIVRIASHVRLRTSEVKLRNE